jgi:hypothetical protein
VRRKHLTIAAAAAVAFAGLTVPASADVRPTGPTADPACIAQLTKTRAGPGQTDVVCRRSEALNLPKARADQLKKKILDRARSGAGGATARKAAAATGKATAAGTRAALAPGATGGVLDQCLRQNSEQWRVDRFDACFARIYQLTFKDVRTHRVTAAVDLQFVVYAQVHPNQNWSVNVTFNKVFQTGDLSQTLLTGHIDCQGPCARDVQNFPAVNLGFPVVDVTVGADLHGTLTQRNISAITATFLAMNTTRPNTVPAEDDFVVFAGIRCDTMFSNRQAGCVFPGEAPNHLTLSRYFLNAHQFPDVAQHVLAAQQVGIRGHDIPLHRADKGREDANRAAACPPSRGRPRPRGKTCDEYPFASTMEGAAVGCCGTTFPWLNCGIRDLPTPEELGDPSWSACLIDREENEQAGNDLGEFYADNRIIPGDEFTVEFI